MLAHGDKGPCKNYVIPLGGGGGSPKDYEILQKDYVGWVGGWVRLGALPIEKNKQTSRVGHS